MGRFDGPHFEVEKEDVVSIWIAQAAIPDGYFDENYSEDDDAPFNVFSTDFGFGYYDHDFVELITDDEEPRDLPIRELLDGSSYSSSFLDVAVKLAEERGLVRSSAAYLIYNFKYDPIVTGIVESPCLKFLGVFPFNKKAP